MKKIIVFLFISALLITTANAQFFSLQIGDSKTRVVSELKDKGLRYYTYSEERDEITFIATSMTEDGEVIGSLPKTEYDLPVIMVRASFKADKLTDLLLVFSEKLKMDAVDLSFYSAQWSETFNASSKIGLREWLYLDNELSTARQKVFYNPDKKHQFVFMSHNIEEQEWYLMLTVVE